jgi:hypothetical protein
VRQPTGSYFVRLDVQPHAEHAPSDGAVKGRAGLGSPGSGHRRHRRRRTSGTRVFLALVVIALGAWLVWAGRQPGGVSGTVDRWIAHVRGDVASVSADPDIATARHFYTGQYLATKAYPQMTESDLAAAGIGVGIDVDWCNSQAVVIQGADGGGTVSYLLLSGHDLGKVTNKVGCPTDFAHPAPWK